MKRETYKSSKAHRSSLEDTKKKNTKRALVSSMLALVLCCVMLIGTTFAWFTDSVTSGKNKIVAGNLDVELEYKQPSIGNDGAVTYAGWADVEENTSVFLASDATLWEPGHMEVAYLKVSNVGTLALKYQLSINAVDTVKSKSVTGNEIALSNYLEYAVIPLESDMVYASREEVRTALTSVTSVKLTEVFSSGDKILYPENNKPTDGVSEQYVALVVYMPETVGNEANYDKANGEVAPEVDLGIELVATQTPYEEDSFDETYDETVAYPGHVSTEDELKSAFANAQDGDKIILDDDMSITFGKNNENGTPDTYILADNVIIDLNGKTLTVNSNDKFMLAGDNITIKNGTIKAGPMGTGKISYSLGVTAGSKNVTIENITCEGGIEVLGNGASAILRNVNVTATNYYAIYLAGGATAIVESGTFTSAAGKVHFYTQTSNDKVIVNGGTFIGGTEIHGGNGTIEDNR